MRHHEALEEKGRETMMGSRQGADFRGPRWVAQRLDSPRAELGEGPRWDDRAGCFLWVDILRGTVYASEPGDGWRHTTVTTRPGFVSLAHPAPGGGVVLAQRDCVQWLDGRGEVLHEVEVPLGENERFNDGALDRRGRLVIGSMSIDASPGAGRLWRIGSAGEVECLKEGATVPNGIAWSPDGSVAYWVDSGEQELKVFRCEPSTGDWLQQIAAWDFAAEEGVPDGISIDRDGSLWVAMWDGWRVDRFSPDGSLTGRVMVPTARPTACALDGSRGTTMFITSAVDPTSVGADESNAGSAFAVSL